MNSDMSSSYLPSIKTPAGGGGGGNPLVVVSSPATTPGLLSHVPSTSFTAQGGDRGGTGGGGGERGGAVRLPAATATGAVVVSPSSPVLKHVGNKGIREAAIRMMKSVRSGKVQLDNHEGRKAGRKTSFTDHQESLDREEEIALVSGVRLSSVIAFEKFLESTLQIYASRSLKQIRGKEDSSQAQSTVAMAVFNLPFDAQRRATGTVYVLRGGTPSHEGDSVV